MAGLEHKLIRCYAEGRPGHWEAFCLDFDLAVQGKSFHDVYSKLNEQLELYVEGVAALPAAERARLINRRAPFSSWLRVSLIVLLSNLGRSQNRPERASFDLSLDDCRAAA